MNLTDARKIAQTVTREQMADMFERAKTGVKDWTAISGVSPYYTKGRAWNQFYPVFMSGQHLSKPLLAYMVHEFGDFLDEHLKYPYRARPVVDPLHEEPVFEVTV